MPVQSDKLRLLRRIPDIRFEEELRGYSKGQVDRVLENLAPLADEIEALQSRLSEAETRAASAEARLMERGTQPVAPVVAPVPEPAIPPTPADFDETLRKTLLMAQRTADETVKEAREEADQLRNNAHSEADLTLSKSRAESEQLDAEVGARRAEMLEEANAEHHRLLEEARNETEARRQTLEDELNEAEGTQRAELLEQIANLQHIRTLLTSDIETLEAHLAQRRASVRAALDEIATVLDDPSALSTEATPAVEMIPPVDSADYQPVVVTSSAESLPAAPLTADLPTLSSEEVLSPEPTVEDETLPAASVEPVEGFIDDLPVAADPLALAGVPDAPPTGAVEVVGALEELVEDGEEAPGIVAPQAPEAAQDPTGDGTLQDPFSLGDAPSVFATVPDLDDLGTDGLASVEQFNVLPDESPFASASDFADSSGPATDMGGPATQEFSFSDLAADGDVGDVTADGAVAGVGEVNDDPWADAPSKPADQGSDLAWADEADGSATPPPPTVVQDPFLEQLRQATSEEGGNDDALDRFFEGDDGDRKGGWFGRRK